MPLQNYWGWWFTTFIALALFLFITRYTPAARNVSFDRLAVISYTLTGLAEISSTLVLDLGGPALAGFFAMSPWALLAWMKMGEK